MPSNPHFTPAKFSGESASSPIVNNTPPSPSPSPSPSLTLHSFSLPLPQPYISQARWYLSIPQNNLLNSNESENMADFIKDAKSAMGNQGGGQEQGSQAGGGGMGGNQGIDNSVNQGNLGHPPSFPAETRLMFVCI